MKYQLFGTGNYNTEIIADAINEQVANQKLKEKFYQEVSASITQKVGKTATISFCHKNKELYSTNQLIDNVDEVLVIRAWKVFKKQYGNEMSIREV